MWPYSTLSLRAASSASASEFVQMIVHLQAYGANHRDSLPTGPACGLPTATLEWQAMAYIP